MAVVPMKTLSLLFLVPVLGGCAELRSEYAPATGEPLRVHDRTVQREGVEQVETGHTENSKGETIATSYENQTVHWTEREVYPLQGRQRIDDESFYRIAHDDDAVRKYDDYHHGGISKNVLGWILMPLGLGVMGGSTGTWIYGDGMKDASGALTKDGATWQTASYVGLGIGAALAVLGFTLVSTGRQQAAAPDVRLIDDPARMKRDAMIYDRALMNTGTFQQPGWRRMYAR